MIGKYLKTDFYRLLHSSTFYIATVSVLAVYLISTLQCMEITSVVEMLWYIKFYSFIICLFAASSFAFSNSLLEDVEHKFCNVSVLRGNCKSYICSKVICCFGASMLAILLGTLFYSCLLHLRLPFYDLNNMTMTKIIREHDIFGSLISEGGFFLYFLCSGVMMGLLGGMLALVSMWLSLIAKNRMFAVCFPVIAYYFSVNYLTSLFGSDFVFVNINGIYLYSCYIFEDAPVLSFVYALIFAFAVSMVLEKLICRQVCKIWR